MRTLWHDEGFEAVGLDWLRELRHRVWRGLLQYV